MFLRMRLLPILFSRITKFQKLENCTNTLIRTFKSDISLEKLYPNSTLKIFTPSPPPQNEKKFTGYIPLDQLQITYSRSSGPGGQHVNCVNTKVEIRFHLETAKWIPEIARQRIQNEYKNRINKDGYYITKSDVTRSQQMNLADALEKLRCLIRELELPKTKEMSTESIEILRRRYERAARERLQTKRYRSQVKENRQNPTMELL